MWRLRPAVLRGAIWALLSVLRIRRQLKRRGLSYQPLAVPNLPEKAAPGVRGVLTRLSPTCLEHALVWQAWLAARSLPRAVVIGVLPTGVGQDRAAHAWVDGTDPASAAKYRELHRIPAPAGK